MENQLATQESEISKGLAVPRAERDLLIDEFNEVSRLEITTENLSTFKELRLKIVKNRTKGINVWHKNGKEVSLRMGQLYDSIKKTECQINESMEKVLHDAENHFENIEKERLKTLNNERVELIKHYVDEIDYRDYGVMDNDVFEAYFDAKKNLFDEIKKKELIANISRMKKVAEEEERIEAIEKENEVLRHERKEKEKELEKVIEEKRVIAANRLRVELEAKNKVENELKLVRDKELQQEKKRLELIQLQLNKGDEEKFSDLIKDLNDLKTKYSFASEKNIKMYNGIIILISKVVDYATKSSRKDK